MPRGVGRVRSAGRGQPRPVGHPPPGPRPGAAARTGHSAMSPAAVSLNPQALRQNARRGASKSTWSHVQPAARLPSAAARTRAVPTPWPRHRCATTVSSTKAWIPPSQATLTNPTSSAPSRAHTHPRLCRSSLLLQSVRPTGPSNPWRAGRSGRVCAGRGGAGGRPPRPLDRRGGHRHLPADPGRHTTRAALWSADVAAPVLRRLADKADIVFVGLDEAQGLWGSALTADDVRHLLPVPGIVVVKDGSRTATPSHPRARPPSPRCAHAWWNRWERETPSRRAS